MAKSEILTKTNILGRYGRAAVYLVRTEDCDYGVYIAYRDYYPVRSLEKAQKVFNEAVEVVAAAIEEMDERWKRWEGEEVKG